MKSAHVLVRVLFSGVVSMVCASTGHGAELKPPGESILVSGQPRSNVVISKFTAQKASQQTPFIKNENQLKDPRVKFYAKMDTGNVFVTDEGVDYAVFSGQKDGRKAWMIREKLLNARTVSVQGLIPSSAKVSSFRGSDPAAWRGNLAAFEEVTFSTVYDGITLKLRAYGGSAEKIFEIDKGANPDAITIRIDGASRLTVNGAGALEIETGIGVIAMTAPVAYQDINGKRTKVAASYRVNPENNSYAFNIGTYDEDFPLVIDPSLLASTFIGGSTDDVANATALANDGSGDIIITGYSNSVDYPGTPGAYQSGHEPAPAIGCGFCEYDAFVSRFDSDLKILRASTSIGGTYRGGNCGSCNNESANAIAIDKAGNILIAGHTNAMDFPTTAKAISHSIDKVNGDNTDGFIAKLSGNLDTLLASTYIGNWRWDGVTAMVLDSANNVYVGGYGGEFLPAGKGYRTSYDYGDAFIAKIDPGLETILAGSLFGGNGEESISGMSFDSRGNLFFTGHTTGSTNLPMTSGAYATTLKGGQDAYIAKFDSGLMNLLATTYLGGSHPYDYTNAIAVDTADNVYVAGSTESTDFPFTQGAYDTSHNSGSDVIIAKFNPNLSKLLASTFIGGNWFESASGIALDSSGNVYVAGNTGSTSFPVTIDAYSKALNLGVYTYDTYDGFVAKLDSDLKKLSYSTYFGGTKSDYINALVLGAGNTITVTGYTVSGNFPTTPGSYSTTLTLNNGWPYAETFVARMKVPENLWVEVTGSTFIPPGGEGEFMVKYKSTLTGEAQDAIVVIDLPRDLEVTAVSAGGTFYQGNGCGSQLFWKIGKIPVGSEGFVTFKLTVPWGTATAEVNIGARIAAANFPVTGIDLNRYLTYAPRQTLAAVSLTKAELDALLLANQPLNNLLKKTLALGYLFFDVATRVTLKDGEVVYELTLLSPKGVPTVLTAAGSEVKGLSLQGSKMTLFDGEGGFVWDRNLGTYDEWSDTAAVTSNGKRTYKGTTAEKNRCLFNCFVEQVPKKVLEKVSEKFDVLNKTIGCAKCGYSLGSGNPDLDACTDCTKDITAERWKDIGKEIPGLGDAVDAVMAIKTCTTDCARDPSSHICTASIRTCCDSNLIANLKGTDGWCERICNTTVGIYAPVESKSGWCQSGEVCEKGQCTDPCWNNTAGVDPPCNKKKLEIRVAHDPNAKSADIKGDVVPGERITYTIEYENMGAGTAYGVFVLDKVPAELDAQSLIINNSGEYSETSRLLSWDVGELAGHQQGQVSFSARVLATAPSGTQITNSADVHFPSADEVTPTNPVTHIVKSLAANPQRLAATAGQPLAIHLTGQGTGLTYVIVSTPKFGTVTGTPPELLYTPDVNSSGIDTIAFQVEKGLEKSNTAEITLEIIPNPQDVTSPLVVRVTPENGQTSLPVNPVAVETGVYSPNIEALFNEPMKAATITAGTFTVSGLSGTVRYDDALQKAVFTPAAPLATGQSYQVKLGTGISDLAGNSLSAPYVWNFSTAGSAAIVVSLPYGLSRLDMSKVPTNAIEMQAINLSNRGTGALTIGQIALDGTNKALFKIVNDDCSGKTLNSVGNCQLQIEFSAKSAGSFTAELKIPSDDPLSPLLSVGLIGSAVGATMAGDCDGTGSVTISEVQSSINMFLSLKSVLGCVDTDTNGSVTISEVQKVINSFLGL